MFSPQRGLVRARARALFRVTLPLLVVLVVAACGGASDAAGDEAAFACPEPSPRLEVSSTELNLFVWTEYIPQEAIDCFEEVYGINVNRDEYSSNEEMYAKLSAGGASFDVAQPTDYIIPLMIRQGVVQPLDKSKLPVLDGFDPTYLNFDFDPENQYSIPYQAGTQALIANSDAVEAMPASWADLWNEEYAGRMVFLDDSRAVIGLTLMTLGYDANSTDPAQLAEASAKLAALVPAIKLFDSDSPKTALIAGDVDLGMTWTGEAVLAQRENPAIEYIYPSEGAILWQDNYVLLADAPNADAAYAWINYTMQPELFWLMLRDFPYTMPSRAALEYARDNQPELYEEYMASNITNTPPEVIEAGVRIEDVGDALPLFDEIWTEVKSQ
jgi:spermidine/putrescine-binding protein